MAPSLGQEDFLPVTTREAAGACFYCDCILAPRHDISNPDARTADHVIPKVALRRVRWLFSSEWHALNRVPCCQRCNQAKGNMLPMDWCETLPTTEAQARLTTRMLELGVQRLSHAKSWL